MKDNICDLRESCYSFQKAITFSKSQKILKLHSTKKYNKWYNKKNYSYGGLFNSSNFLELVATGYINHYFEKCSCHFSSQPKGIECGCLVGVVSKAPYVPNSTGTYNS